MPKDLKGVTSVLQQMISLLQYMLNLLFFCMQTITALLATSAIDLNAH